METNNGHGKWLVRGSAEDRAELERQIGHKLPNDDDRVTRKSGPPDPGIPQCTYCGSITPEDFAKACQDGLPMEVADWKYGWPHKVYIEWPSPSPDEQRETGCKYEGGKITERYYGTYRTLQLKFYTEHLAEWPELAKHADLIERRIGIRFEMTERGLHWKRTR